MVWYGLFQYHDMRKGMLPYWVFPYSVSAYRVSAYTVSA